MVSRRAILLLCACACTTPEDRWLDYPPLEDAKALVLATEIDGVIDYAEAYALEPRPESLHLTAFVLAKARVYALIYERPLDELGLDEGPLESLPAPEGRPLPEPDAAYQRSIEGDSSRWSAAGERMFDRYTARYRVIDPPPCTQFRARIQTAASTSEHRFSVTASDRSVLIGSDAGELFVATATSVVPITDRPAGFDPEIAAPDPEGGILFGVGGVIWKGRVVPPASIEAEPFVTLGTTLPLRAIFGRTLPLELFVITGEKRLILVDYTGNHALHVFDPTSGDFAIASSGPDDSVAVGGATNVVHFRGGIVELEPTPLTSDTLSSVAAVEDLGYVAGTSGGRIVRRGETGWESAGDTGFALEVRAFGSYPGGFVYGGANGGFGQYVEGRGFCEPEAPLPGQINGLHTIGDKVILVQKQFSTGIAVLEP